MSKKLLLIIVLVSLAFNLAFIGSFFYWQYQFKCDFMKAKPSPGRLENSPGACNDQPPPPPGLRRGDMGWMGNRQVIEPYREKFFESKKEFFKELQQPVVNEEILKQKLQGSLQNHTELEKQIGLRLIEMRKKMNSKEAAEFFGRHADRNSMKRNENIQHRKRRNQ